jgi:hypothetical protein
MRVAAMSLVPVWAIAACTGDSVDLTPGDDDDDEQDCAGADTYVDGIEQTTPSGRTVKLMSASPTPPDVGDNAWTLEVLDAAGAPEEGLQLELLPWMPLHGHGLSPPTYGSTEAGGGTYELETFDLIMPGLWQFTIDAGIATGEPDEAVFMFCAEG